MKKFVKQLRLSRQQFYETHLSIVISILPTKLSPKEIEVLAAFMSLDKRMAEDKFGVVGRVFVKDKLRISAAGLSNYLKIFKDKGFLLDVDGVLSIHPKVYSDEICHEYNFKIELSDEE